MKKQKVYVGIGTGKKRNFFCMMDKDGNVLRRGKYPNTRTDAAALAKDIAVRYDPEIVCESTANMTMPYTFRALGGRHYMQNVPTQGAEHLYRSFRKGGPYRLTSTARQPPPSRGGSQPHGHLILVKEGMPILR